MDGAGGRLAEGRDALAAGRWDDATVLLEEAAAIAAGPDLAAALDGLAEARWWLGQADDAVAARERAYGVRRALADAPGAARAAAWLAREYAAGLGNVGAAQGWLARAETLAAQAGDAAATGWVALARAALADAPGEQAAAAEAALEAGRRAGDGDLEVLALARLGLARMVGGDTDGGMRCLDEAMAAATGGEAEGVTTLPQVCCDFVLAAELSGEPGRFARWSEVVDRVAARRGQPSAVTFCTTCCAETSAAHGDFDAAEKQLHVAVVELERSGRRARCVPPGTKLAELCLLQGRLEEAERAVGTADDETSLLVRARLALARGDPGAAVVLAERCARRLGGETALAVLVEAHLAAGDADAAAEAAGRLSALAEVGRNRRAAGQAALARARVALARGDTAAARRSFEDALDGLRGAAPVEAAQAHFELARLHAADRPEAARVDAKAALVAFEAAGAARLADQAAALLRSLGDRSRVGPKDVGVLTRREQEVLRLVAQGLTNAELAERLYISTKTAGNHVSAILAKLGLRSRTEAAAYAALHADR